MYLCMCTPDLYFTSTEVFTRLQNKSTKICSTKEQLLFFFYKFMLRWFARVRRTQALSLPHQLSALLFKGKCRQQVKSPAGAGNSTKHWSSLALPSCSSHLLLRCFPPGILKHYLPLAAFINKGCSKRKEKLGVSMFPSSPSDSEKDISGCSLLAKGALAETGRWEQADGTPDGHTLFLPHFCGSRRDSLSASHS